MEWDRTRTIAAILINSNSKERRSPEKIKPLRILDALRKIESMKDLESRDQEFKDLQAFYQKVQLKQNKE